MTVGKSNGQYAVSLALSHRTLEHNRLTLLAALGTFGVQSSLAIEDGLILLCT